MFRSPTRTFVLATFVCVLGLATPLLSSAQGTAPLGSKARVYKSNAGTPLTQPSGEKPGAIVAQFLRDRGAEPTTVESLRQTALFRSEVTGRTHIRMEQEVAGLRVEGAYVKAAINNRGELVHLIENVASVSGTVKPADANEKQALRVALSALYPDLRDDIPETTRTGNVTVFAKNWFFYRAPTVERVLIPTHDGLEDGFLVQTWSNTGNLLHYTLVSGNGQIVSIESRTNRDSYRVFTESPEVTSQSVLPGPGQTTASPAGWLFTGTQKTINITGNNVHAYLDADSNNRPDRGGDIVTDGNFWATADLTVPPSSPANRNVAVQNLFYLNNVIHDILYDKGFTEAVGNFQEDNFSRGGVGSDSVNAEAQDGGGTDNANFATPRDGQNPRMQMYLWTGKGNTHEVAVNSPSSAIYAAAPAEFGPALNTTGITGDVVLVIDSGGTTSDACETITNNVSGKIALIDRGTCNFTVKVSNAQQAGAIAAIVANNQGGDSILIMGGTDRKIRIPSVLVSQNDGAALRITATNATARLKDPQPLQIDGDLDADIVYHEYGHGLTWRMIGGMNGPLAGAIGEGMSDVLAFLAIPNGDDVMAEYASSDANGIRRCRYSLCTWTYQDVTGAEVHDDGEVYATIGWDLLQNYLKEYRANGRDMLLADVVDGMNYTPSTPAFEDMRDGILQAVAGDTEKTCLVWKAFALRGVGVGASGTSDSTGVHITPSNELPTACQ